MAPLFLEHLGGRATYSCAYCRTFLTNRSLIISTSFTGNRSRAYLFKRVVNVAYGSTQERLMLTGRHIVRDVMCIKCGLRLGWMYEYAVPNEQKYKEGCVVLERYLIVEAAGLLSGE